LECWSDARCRMMRLQPCRDRVASDANDTNVKNGVNVGEHHYIEERCRIIEGDLEDCKLKKLWEFRVVVEL
jgi:hypothetical protein